MKIFNPPYRWWTWRTFFLNIGWCLWDIKHGIRNLWTWKDVVWNDYDFDWEPLARVIVFKLRRMEPVMRGGMHVNGERHAREIAICAALLERVMKDEYFTDALARGSVDAYKKADAQAKADLELFGKMFTRHLRSWWD